MLLLLLYVLSHMWYVADYLVYAVVVYVVVVVCVVVVCVVSPGVRSRLPCICCCCCCMCCLTWGT